jgi:hypothetical protein
VLSIAHVDGNGNMNEAHENIIPTDIPPPIPALFNATYIKVQCNNHMLGLIFDYDILLSRVAITNILHDLSFVKHFKDMSYRAICLQFIGSYIITINNLIILHLNDIYNISDNIKTSHDNHI